LKELPGMLRKWREGPVDDAVDTRGHRYKWVTPLKDYPRT
jgi:hypothetical protein